MAGQMWDLAATPIGQAINAGDVNEVNRLVKNGENIFFKDRKQNTFVHYISTMYRPSVFYALIAHGIDIQAQNRHGNTALHVTALQRETGHVGDLLACGVDPFIKNKDGKRAEDLKTQNKYWYMIYEKYKKMFGEAWSEGPGLFHAVKKHDIEGIHRLLRCWCRVDALYKKQTLRQYAALLKFHDIVVIIDEHMATNNMIYGLFEGNHEKVREALTKTRCRVNFLNEISAKKHILQYAIKFKDFRFVKMLCDAGADVNTSVRVHNYFWGPLYFEAINKDTPLEILRYILQSGADFSLKDERGRTAFMYALDKINGDLPLDIFQYMLARGSDITERDCTGCNPRDIARFSRRQDVVEIIDKFYIKMIRCSDCQGLRQLAVDGYDSLMITHNYRDTFIYASGNKTDDVLRFLNWLPKFEDARRRLHVAVETGSLDGASNVLDSCLLPELVVNSRNKARRTPLIIAVIHEQGDMVEFLLNLPYPVDINARDCRNRTAYHFACCLTGDVAGRIKECLQEAGAEVGLKDVKGLTGEELAIMEGGNQVISNERKSVYGLALQLLCVDQYEELRKLIRSKKKGLTEFISFVRCCKFPVAALWKMLAPLMQSYRDPIFLAIDYGKQDIAYRLAQMGSNLVRQEKYERTSEDGIITSKFYTPSERASHLGMQELAEYLTSIRALQVEKLRKHSPLLPKRVMQKYFATSSSPTRSRLGRSNSCVFITQSVQ